MKKLIVTATTALFFMASAGAAMATADFIPPFDGQHQSLANGVDYYSGGVGITERQQMQKMTSGDNLKLIFDAKSGNYIAGVAVTIEDAKGTVVIDTIANGPWFSAKLPAGTYRVVTRFDHHQMVRTVSVSQKPTDLILSWKV